MVSCEFVEVTFCNLRGPLYVHMCMHTCECVCMYGCNYTNVYDMCICMHGRMNIKYRKIYINIWYTWIYEYYEHMDGNMNACLYGWINVDRYACMYIYVYIYLYMYICVYVCVYVYIYVYVYICMCVSTHDCVYMHMYVYMYAYM